VAAPGFVPLIAADFEEFLFGFIEKKN